jgi:hypothetical protein
MTPLKLTNLRSLIAGYFHEDWRLEAASHAEAVRHFVQREPPDAVAAARTELEALLTSDPTEAQLRSLVMDDWNSSYNPEFDRKTMREWLEEIRSALGA